MIREWMGEMGLGCLTWLPLPVVLVGGGVGAVIAAVVGGIIALFFGGTFLACCGGTLIVMTIDRATSSVEPVEVAGHHWERTIYIKEVVVKEQDDWCHNMPDGAVETDRRDKFHHREKRIGPDRSVYEDWCEYRVAEWDNVSPLKESGNNTKPSWPELGDTDCTKVGCRSEQRREEELEVLFERTSGHSGTPWPCEMKDDQDWLSWGKGDQATLLVGGFVGAPYCDQLVRKGAARKVPKSSPKPKPSPRPKKDKKKGKKKGKGKRR